MKHSFYLVALAALLICSGCQSADPEPDYSGIQDLSFTITTKSNLLQSTDAVWVYPTFIDDLVYVDIATQGGIPVTVYLSDEKGKYTNKIELPQGAGEHQAVLDFSAMPKGVYLSEVHMADKVSRIRLVKK